MTNLEIRLADLAHALDIDDTGLVDSIVARVDRSSLGLRPAHRRLQLAAAFVLVVAVAIALIPESRRVVARWFGLNQVRIERDANLDV
ncbi:MAG: hypothetical protein ACYC0U_08750, partial [Ilumatobacteraceae bacterium]